MKEEGLDTGDLLLEKNIKIDINETLISLTKKLSDYLQIYF